MKDTSTYLNKEAKKLLKRFIKSLVTEVKDIIDEEDKDLLQKIKTIAYYIDWSENVEIIQDPQLDNVWLVLDHNNEVGVIVNFETNEVIDEFEALDFSKAASMYSKREIW